MIVETHSPWRRRVSSPHPPYMIVDGGLFLWQLRPTHPDGGSFLLHDSWDPLTMTEARFFSSMIVESHLPWRRRIETHSPWRRRIETHSPWRRRIEIHSPWRRRIETHSPWRRLVSSPRPPWRVCVTPAWCRPATWAPSERRSSPSPSARSTWTAPGHRQQGLTC
jgi:hypothetical protein